MGPGQAPLGARRTNGVSPDPAASPSKDLQLYAARGVEIMRAVSGFVLTHIESGSLRNEVVVLRGLKRTKTSADQISDDLLHQLLRDSFPEMPILSETNRAAGLAGKEAIRRGQIYAVPDGIDGTAHLRAGDGQWLINLAFCQDGRALVGVCAVPAEGKIYLGVRGQPSIVMGLKGDQTTVLAPPAPRSGLVMGICSPLDAGGIGPVYERWLKLAELNGASETPVFGSAYSYLKVADGTLDVFANLAGNFHWDKAAAHVILEGAGRLLGQIDWDKPEHDVSSAKECDYDPSFIKDEGHVAACPGVTLKIPPELRCAWKAVIE